MSGVYIGLWSCFEDVVRDFHPDLYGEGASSFHDTMSTVDIIFAYYTDEDYTGEAWVLFYDRADGRHCEVSGSHCSCYGLEGQWTPEVCLYDVLMHRMDEGNLGRDYDGSNKFAEQLQDAIGRGHGHRTLAWMARETKHLSS